MSTTFLATLYKFFSIAGIAHSSSGCPQAGTVLSESCVTVFAQDVSGTNQQTFVKEYTVANGSCGTYTIQDPLVEGVCGHPPSGWAISYSPQSITVPDIYWNHPQNPSYGQLAHPQQDYLESYGITYYTSYPDTYSTGWQRSNGEILAQIDGQDGWKLTITYTGMSTYSYIEDDLTP